MSNNERLGKLFREYVENREAIKDIDATLRSYGYRLRELGSTLEDVPEYVRIKGEELLYGEDYIMDIEQDAISKVSRLLKERIDAKSKEEEMMREIEENDWENLFDALIQQ